MMPMVQTAETVESPQLQSIQVVDTSFVAKKQLLMVQTVRRTMDIPQLLYTVADVPVVQVLQVVDLPVVARLQIPLRSHICSSSYSLDNVVDILVVAQLLIPLIRFPLRFSSCSTLIRWSTFAVHVLQFSRADVERQPSSHSCSLLNSGLAVACPLYATTGAEWFGVQKTALVPQLQCSDMVSGFF